MTALPQDLAAMATLPAQPGAPRLAPDEIAAALLVLRDWSCPGDRLEKTFRFGDYAATIGFVNAVAWIAQRLDHHPDLEVGYNRCRVVWSTHDAGGVTRNDCTAAARTEALVG